MVVVKIDDLPFGRIRYSLFLLSILFLYGLVDFNKFYVVAKAITDDTDLIKRMFKLAYRFATSRTKYLMIKWKDVKKLGRSEVFI